MITVLMTAFLILQSCEKQKDFEQDFQSSGEVKNDNSHFSEIPQLSIEKENSNQNLERLAYTPYTISSCGFPTFQNGTIMRTLSLNQSITCNTGTTSIRICNSSSEYCGRCYEFDLLGPVTNVSQITVDHVALQNAIGPYGCGGSVFVYCSN